MSGRTACGPVVRPRDHHEVVHRLALAIEYFSRGDDARDLVKVKRDLVKVKQSERVVSSVDEVCELVVRRKVSVTCERYADLHQ